MDSIENLLKDSNIVNIMNAIANRYIKSIDPDEIESIKMMTLWKCRDKYDPNRGAKFTTYLYQQLSFALKNELKKKKRMVYLDNLQLDFFGYTGGKQRYALRSTPTMTHPRSGLAGPGITEREDSAIEFSDALNGLPEDVSNILQQRFISNMTMVEIAKVNGYSRETARRRLKRAIKICKKSNGYVA